MSQSNRCHIGVTDGLNKLKKLKTTDILWVPTYYNFAWVPHTSGVWPLLTPPPPYFAHWQHVVSMHIRVMYVIDGEMTCENLSASSVALEMSSLRSERNLAMSLTRPNRMSVWSVLSWASSTIITLTYTPHTHDTLTQLCVWTMHTVPSHSSAYTVVMATGQAYVERQNWVSVVTFVSPAKMT